MGKKVSILLHRVVNCANVPGSAVKPGNSIQVSHMAGQESNRLSHQQWLPETTSVASYGQEAQPCIRLRDPNIGHRCDNRWSNV